MDFIETKWFISYRVFEYGMPPKEALIITDVTPARWILYRKAGTGHDYAILYAEEITPAFAAELAHTGNIETNYFREDD